MARSEALIAPVQWDEPFGMVLAEALAVGAQVVAIDRGGVREATNGAEALVKLVDRIQWDDLLVAVSSAVKHPPSGQERSKAAASIRARLNWDAVAEEARLALGLKGV